MMQFEAWLIIVSLSVTSARDSTAIRLTMLNGMSFARVGELGSIAGTSSEGGKKSFCLRSGYLGWHELGNISEAHRRS
jgi:hypothetical protein